MNPSYSKTVIFIVGPTATGKTRLGVKLARRIKGEVISCDSMQVYRSMKVLSQAPCASEIHKVKHHFVGVLSPEKEYSAAVFRRRALKLIGSITKRKKIPIFVGGSGLYAKALVDGLFPTPPADPAFRQKMLRFVSRYGSKKLHERLTRIDPASAGKIHPNDARRIIRALEIYNSTGKTMTEMKGRTKGLGAIYDIKIFGITKPRDILYSDINARVDRMFSEGVLGEVRRLRSRALSKTAGAVLGFKEIMGYIEGKYDLESAKLLTKRNTRRFAKRQLTWFRADKRIKWFDSDKMTKNSIIDNIIERI